MGFGDRLKMLRKERKISQAELARISGLSQSAISAFEMGINEPTSVSVQQLAKSFGMTPGELLGEGKQNDLQNESLTAQEWQLIMDYRALTSQGREYIRQQFFMAKQIYTGESHFSQVEAR